MKYLVKYTIFGSPHLVVVADDELLVARTDHYRTKRVRNSPIGRIREVEAAGKRDDMVDLYFKGATTERGYKANQPQTSIDLKDSRQHVREMSPTADAELADVDARIEAKKDELNELRSEREAVVKRSWRSARQIWADELTKRALAREADNA